MLKIFFTSFFQVLFVCANIVAIQKNNYIFILLLGFMISFLWCFNVEKIAISKMNEKLIYASGASIGGMVGVIITNTLLNIIN